MSRMIQVKNSTIYTWVSDCPPSPISVRRRPTGQYQTLSRSAFLIRLSMALRRMYSPSMSRLGRSAVTAFIIGVSTDLRIMDSAENKIKVIF